MDVSVVGINHRTAPVETRERFALPGELSKRLLRALATEKLFEEAMVLDTCNRTELYFVSTAPQDALECFLGHVARLKGGQAGADTSAFYCYDGAAAVRHLFRVAAALDSQVVGEHQILGQVKDAYRRALEERTARFLLNKLLHRAFRVGKRVQAETDLGRGSASVAREAVDLAGQIFSELAGKTVLLVGAGQTAELVAGYLVRRGVRELIVANRTLARARQLVDDLAAGRVTDKARRGDQTAPDSDADEQVQCPAVRRRSAERTADEHPTSPDRPATRAIELAGLPGVIAEVDLVICSTGSPGLVLTSDDLPGVTRRGDRLLFIVDIAVPRDVDPELARLPNVFLYNLDDLNSVVARNIERRCMEIPRAEAIVDFEVEQFVRWRRSLQAAPTIKLLRRRLDMLREAEVRRYARKFSSGDHEQLERFTRGLCNKLVHQPIAFLRSLSEEATTSDELAAVDVIRRIFELDALEDDQ